MSFRDRNVEDRLAELGKTLRSERSVYPIRLDTAEVLFRIDGILFEISPQAYELVTRLLSDEPSAGLAMLVQEWDSDTFGQVAQDLLELEAGGWLQSRSPVTPAVVDNQPADVQTGGLCLLVSQTCNLNCQYCYAGGGTYGGEAEWMSFSTACHAIESLLERSPARRRFSIVFFGGEPLLNFPLVRRVVAFCEDLAQTDGKVFHYSLTTNGTILNQTILRFLVDHRFSIMASYDSKSYQDRLRPYRNGRSSGERVRKNLRRLFEAGLPVQVRGTVVRDMIRPGFLEAFAREVRDLGGRQLVLSAVDCSANPEAKFALDEKAKDALQASFDYLSQDHIRRVGQGHEEPVVFDPHILMIRALAMGTTGEFAGCGACFGMTAVSTDGKLYPCHRFVGKEGFSIGEVAKGVDRAAVERFFDSHKAAVGDRCERCMARRVCSGMCYHHLARDRGRFTAPSEEECTRFRRTIEAAIDLTLRLRRMPPGAIRQYSRITGHLG